MHIALDAMGSDTNPVPDVAGGVLAAREFGDTILLVGDEPRVRAELSKHDVATLPIQIVHADEQITMTDKPSAILKAKTRSSMHIGMELVRDGEADAFVSMGNTGAAYAIAMLNSLKRIESVKRPALTAVFPIRKSPMIFLDIGANADARVDWLEQFALMGSIYAETALRKPNPRVATLSNGEEEGKGNQLTREAQERFKTLNINYVGHVEPKELLDGEADVIVMDGFVGNIFIKTFEATIRYFTDVMRTELKASPVSLLGGALSRGAFERVRAQLDTAEVGGAPLLGVNGIVIIGHGGSNAVAVKNAINQARLAVEGKTIEILRERLAQYQSNSQT